MKKRCSIYLVAGTFLLSGCSNDLQQPETDGERTPIVFSASGITVSAEEQTRAAGDAFPNSGEITIVAAEATSTTADWGKLYMDHVAATAATEASSKHSVTTDGSTVYYWPFNPDEYLSFAAYSPRTDGMLSIQTDKSKLRVAPTEGNSTYTYPDLLCTPVVEPCNKTHGEVELPFEHVMAQVEINVTAINDRGEEIEEPTPAITITSLTLATKVAGGTFDLSSNSWTLDDAVTYFPATPFCTLIEGQKIPQKGTCLLLPNTETNVQVSIKLTDASGAEVTKTATVNEFNTGSNGNVLSAKLERGKKSVLNFKVKLKDITTGNTEAVILQGDLAPWDYKGESSVTIE